MNGKESTEEKRKERLIQAGYLVSGILLVFIAVRFFHALEPMVRTSFQSHPPETSDPDTLLNHANTYYWWGRYRENTLPEFDTAAVWAGKAILLAEAKFEKDRDTSAFLQRKRQAEQLIALAKHQADICRSNIGSFVPAYMEIMGYDDAYMHEDADPENVPEVALRGALNKLIELLSPDKGQPISLRSSFVLLNVNTTNPKAEEMLVQELNNKTRMYTISPHELSKISGKDSIRIKDILADSLLLSKIASSFNTDELSVIDFTENDKVNGIYYYGMRLRIWNPKQGWNSRNTYTEYMVRDRVFNQITVFIGRLILVVLLLALGMNFIMMPFALWFSNFRPVTPYYFLLCCIIAMLAQYLLVTFGLKNFLNPSPDAYFVSDPGEQWTFAYPLTFILPGLITYLVLGKMDNFISSFRSDFENPLALFALVAGSLLPMAFSFTYYQTIRFGFSASTNAIFTIVLMVLFIALVVSRYWSAIINFPQKIHWAVRLTTWMGFGVHILIAFLFAGSLLQYYDNNTIDRWFLNVFLFAAAVMELIKSLTDFFVRKFSKSPSEEISEENQPEDIQTIAIEGDMVIQRLTGKQGNHNNPVEKTYASLYVRSERGTSARNAVVSTLLSKLTEKVDSLVIDFATDKGNSDVHYLPFAKAFEERLSYTKFNDVAETARKTSNFIGKALSAITSAAGILIDDGQTKPRKAKDVADLLMQKISRERTILLLDHIEKIDEENIQLLEALVNAIITKRQETGKADKSPQVLPLLIAFGTGEFGYRDKVLSLLGKLHREGMHKGVLDFKLIFKNASENFLSKKSLPVQAELYLRDLFVRENRDYSPDVVKDTYEALEKNQIIKTVNIEGRDMQMLSLSDLKQLPDTRIGQDLDEAVHQHTPLKDVLIAAAYLADSKGKFHLPVLAYALKMDRIPLLHLLKEAERYNLVYDLKGEEHFYWYAFTDRGLVSDFKEIENPRQEQVSQLANEYFRGFVEFYCSLEDADANAEYLQKMLDSGVLEMDTLFLLAQRANSVHPAFPVLAFVILHMVVNRAGNNGVGMFTEALDFCRKAKDIYLKLNESEREKLGSKHFDLLKMEFLLMLETGMQRAPEIDSLLKAIHDHPLYGLQRDVERHLFELAKVRLFFTRFTVTDEIEGPKICKSLLNEDLQHALKLRARFYDLKLVPSKLLIYSENEEWPQKAIFVNDGYRNLISELEKIYNEDSSYKELYREVLNDYAGSFLTDKMLSIFDLKEESADDEKVKTLCNALGLHTGDALFSKIKELLGKRIALEQQRAVDDSGNFNIDVLRKLILDNSVNVDKRGLCYTLNYYARACKAVGRNQEALDFAKLSYEFNTHVGDMTGACSAAGTAGYACVFLSNFEEAFKWFRSSFGHGWSISHYSRFTMVMHMLWMAEKLKDPAKKQEALLYRQQVVALSACDLFGCENLDENTAIMLLSNKNTLSEKYRKKEEAVYPGNQWGTDAKGFLAKADEFIRLIQVQQENEGVFSFNWNSHEGKYHWEKKAWKDFSDPFEAVQWHLHLEGQDLQVVMKAAKFIGKDEWYFDAPHYYFLKKN